MKVDYCSTLFCIFSKPTKIPPLFKVVCSMRLERSWLCFTLFSLLVALGLDVLVVLLLLRRVHLLELLHLRLGDLFAGRVVGRDALCETKRNACKVTIFNHCLCTVWGSRLRKRFCSMFSGSSPCLLGQHGSFSSAQLPVELVENMLQNLFLTCHPALYDSWISCLFLSNLEE